MRRWRWPLFLVTIAAAAGMLWLLASARRMPVRREATIIVAGWPRGAATLRVLVWSDIHLGNLATNRARLARMIALANLARPDIVLLAGDFIAGHEPSDAAVAPDLAPLAALRARWGVVAVLGNHDHWTDAAAVRAVLRRAGVTVIENAAIRRGPLAIGGLGDAPTGRARPDRVGAAMMRLGGLPLLLAHSPEVPDGFRGLVVAGHTHCGQIVLPLIGPPAEVTAARYRCGIVREPGRTTIVTAGTGTSVVPMRLGAPPDWWLLSFEPAAR